MDEVMSRQEIARQADAAAMRSVATGRCEPCPYAAGTEAAKQWKCSFERSLLAHSNPDAEGSC